MYLLFVYAMPNCFMQYVDYHIGEDRDDICSLQHGSPFISRMFYQYLLKLKEVGYSFVFKSAN